MQIRFSTQSKTQTGEILRLLIDGRGTRVVPFPEIMARAAQYNARILELRRMGFNIENRTDRVNAMRRSWFWLISSPVPEPSELARPATKWEDRPRLEGLVFDVRTQP
jgi:hypothetical protein